MTTHERVIQEMYSSSMERTIKRLWITIMLLIVLLVGTNVAWIIYEAQFEDVTEVKQEVDTGYGSATVSGTGNIYGESKADSN